MEGLDRGSASNSKKEQNEYQLLGESVMDQYKIKCDLCNKTFTTIGNLNRHRTLHTGNKTYFCSVCDKGFYRKEHLFGHMGRIHPSFFT